MHHRCVECSKQIIFKSGVRMFSNTSTFLRIFTLALFISLALAWTLSAQSIQEMSAFTASNERAIHRIQHERDSLAATRGLPILQRLDDGTLMYLERFIGGRPQYLIPMNAFTAASIRTDITRKKYGLTGKDVLIGQWDFLGVFTDHPELQGGRIVQMDGAIPDTGRDHATHVSCTLAGTGINPLAQGMAYEGRVHCYDLTGGDTFRMANEVRANDLRFSNHAYGSAAGWVRGTWHGDTRIHRTIDYKFGYYDWRALDWDSLSVLAPEYLIVKAVGNYRGEGGPIQPPPTLFPENNGGKTGYDCIPTFGVAKNPLVVGAVDAKFGNAMTTYTAWGPTDDGRIKPDIMAHGDAVYSASHTAPTNKPNGYSSLSGSSQSAAAVTGSLAVLHELQTRLDPAIRMRAATWKALLMNTADDFGTSGPDYQSGWGVMNTERVADLLVQHNQCGGFVHNDLLLPQSDSIVLRVRATGDTLKAMICWVDPPSIPHPLDTNAINNQTPFLIHDLDMRVSDGATTFLPWTLKGLNDPAASATPGDNILDNVEQVVVASPQPAQEYTIRITHKGTFRYSQPVSLVVTGICRLKVSAGSDLTICSGDSARLNAMVSCSDGPYTYEWSPRDSTIIDPFTSNPIVLLPGDDSTSRQRSYFVVVRDRHGCEMRDTISVTVREGIRLVTKDAAACKDAPASLSVEVQGGRPPYRYLWEPSFGLNDPTLQNPTVTVTTPMTYRVTVEDANGCIASAIANVTVLPPPAKPGIVRSGDTLTAPPLFSYQWYLDGQPIASATSQQWIARRSGFYQVEVRDVNGCPSISDSIRIDVLAVVTLDMPRLSGDAGSIVHVPIRVRSSYMLEQAGVDSCTITVRFRKNILTPVGTTPPGVIDGTDRLLSLRGKWDSGKATLASFDLLAMLGDVEGTELHFERVEWDSATITTVTIDGGFDLRICRDGGVRLFDGSAVMQIRGNYPNPFNSETVIELSVIEEGLHSVLVLDARGNRVTTLLDESILPGDYVLRFDGSTLASGPYFIVMITPTAVRTYPMRLLK